LLLLLVVSVVVLLFVTKLLAGVVFCIFHSVAADCH
jgi:hypothetical protein